MDSRGRGWTAGAGIALAALVACTQDAPRRAGGSPALTPAHGAVLRQCAGLSEALAFEATTFTASTPVAAGALAVAGTPVAAHCQLSGQMHARTGRDARPYAIGFEMRLPNEWNGRFFYQANGGLDGSVVPATGAVNGGAGLTHALAMGFAVISSDAGHAAALGAAFGLDPQARLDYGYQAAVALTPMAKSVIRAAYGKPPDRSYFGGCSNGGRHALVAAARQPEAYDGYLVGDPGMRLPLAAIANIVGAQALAQVAADPADLGSSFTQGERQLVVQAVLAQCDALDGVVDGMVQDTAACQARFRLERDVASCTGARDGRCLSTAQKSVMERHFAGVQDRSGQAFYSPWPFDAGLATAGWANWKFVSPAQRDAPAVAQIWSVPPEAPATFNGADFAQHTDVDVMLARVRATSAVYPESALSFMMPPHPEDVSALRGRGAKMMVYHGTSDPIFSSDDTTRWYEALDAGAGVDVHDVVRFFRVPGMNHCSGGPSTDQFDMLTPLVEWVEHGQAPQRVTAAARGAGNPAGANPDVPAAWSAGRTRPLCPYPQVARYVGTGDVESAENFACR